MLLIKTLWVMFSSLVLMGCTKAGLEIANLPAKLSDTKILRDVAYGDDPWETLDIYLPSISHSEPLPVLVFFYGGSWMDGSKDQYEFVGENFANQGYITVIADYRKYPQVKFPTFVEDGAKAVAWTVNHMGQYGGEDRVFISGHSAGAHIGALMTADERYLQTHHLTTKSIKAFAGLAGPYDFVPYEENYKDMFGPPENYPQMQVTTFIEGDEPPMLLLWGADDDLVGRRNLDLLVARIEARQGVVETKIYPNMGHVDILSGMVWFLKSKGPVVTDVVDFFRKVSAAEHESRATIVLVQ